MEGFTSKKFLELLKDRNEEAVKKVVESYSSHLFKAGLGMGLAEDQAEEVSHATWATFYEVLPRFQGKSHVRTFLFGIFYNKVMEHKRANKKFSDHENIDDLFDEQFKADGHWINPPQDPHRYLESLEISQIIDHCLDHLNETQKAVFVYKVVMEQGSDEICHELGLSATNLRQLLFRGKAQLKKCIDKNYNQLN